MTTKSLDKMKAIAHKHIAAFVEEICNSHIELGYWPEDETGAMVDAVVAVMVHQARINEYHIKNKTDFLDYITYPKECS